MWVVRMLRSCALEAMLKLDEQKSLRPRLTTLGVEGSEQVESRRPPQACPLLACLTFCSCNAVEEVAKS